jgi:hypothetical protein
MRLSSTNYIHFACLLLAFFIVPVRAILSQTKNDAVDLEMTVVNGSDSARGGETFSYSVIVKNIGSTNASKVILFNASTEAVISAIPTVGICRLSVESRQIPVPYRCDLGEIAAGGFVTINFQLKIPEFGGEPVTAERAKTEKVLSSLLESFGNGEKRDSLRKTEIANLDVTSEEDEEYRDNNYARVSVELLPSRNLPPRIQIVSPKPEAVIVRSSKKDVEVKFLIRAFDPDGSIDKVAVNTQQFSISVEYPENKYFIAGKKYSIKEVEENMKDFQEYFGGDATKTGKEEYSFTLKNPKYGLNTIFITAYDNQGRTSNSSIAINVNSTEFVKPLNNSVIPPNSDFIIETVIKLNDGTIPKLQLIGRFVCCQETLMNLISRNGNIYRHQYLLKNLKKGYYSFQVFLEENTGAFTYSDFVSLKVTEKPTIKISTQKGARDFKEFTDIPSRLTQTILMVRSTRYRLA